jgi:hypothetical protein
MSQKQISQESILKIWIMHNYQYHFFWTCVKGTLQKNRFSKYESCIITNIIVQEIVKSKFQKSSLKIWVMDNYQHDCSKHFWKQVSEESILQIRIMHNRSCNFSELSFGKSMVPTKKQAVISRNTFMRTGVFTQELRATIWQTHVRERSQPRLYQQQLISEKLWEISFHNGKANCDL